MTASAPGTAVQTVGPVDPNAPAVAKVYTVVSSLLGLVTLASTFHLISTEQATAVSNVGTSIVGLVGAGIAALAAFRTHKQVNNGTFDAPPPPPPLPPAITAVQSISAVADQFQDLTRRVAAGISHVSDTAAGLQNILGGGLGQLGPLVEQILQQRQPQT